MIKFSNSRALPMKKKFLIVFVIFHIILISRPCHSQEFEMPSFVHAIDACDMDMDGSNDIIVSCAYEDSIVILFNDGYGNFEPYYYNRITGSAICGCVDEDSIPDIIAGKGQMYFYKNYGDRTLGIGISLMAMSGQFILYGLIDMNNDGWKDMVYDRDINWGLYKNNGDLTFTDLVLGSDNATHPRPSIGHFNSDSIPDIVISYSYSSGLQVTKYLINNGDFNFTYFILNETIFNSIASNLDNIFPDDLLLFYNPTPEVYLYENIGDATFFAKPVYYINNSAGVYFKNRTDYNQDGFDDFSYTQCFWSECTDSLYVELNDKNWSFKPAQKYYIGTLNSFTIKSMDLNGDYFPDLYMTGYNSNNKVKILWNNGDGSFSYFNPVGIKEPNYNMDPKIEVNPNPFLLSTSIKFTSFLPAIVSLKIYNIQGIEIQSLMVDQKIVSGDYEIMWDGTNYSGNTLSPGVYIILLRINGLPSSCKIIHY